MKENRLRDLLGRHESFWCRQGETVSEHQPLQERGGIPLADGTRSADGQLITPDLSGTVPILYRQADLRGDTRGFHGRPGATRHVLDGGRLRLSRTNRYRRTMG